MTTERQQGGSVAGRGEVLSPAGALVRRQDPDRFLFLLFVPAPLRDVAFTIVAFNHELARAVEVGARRNTGSDESRFAGAIRLQWWRDVVEGARRAHEVAEPLGRLLDAGAVEPAPLLSMIAAREMELEGPAADAARWWERLAAGPGQLARAIGLVCGLDGPSLDWCGTAGAAYGAGAVLRHRDRLASLGRHPLPVGADVGEPRRLTAAVTARLDDLPPLRVSRAARAAALHAVLATRDLRRVAAGKERPDRPRPVSDKVAVAAAWWSGRFP